MPKSKRAQSKNGQARCWCFTYFYDGGESVASGGVEDEGGCALTRGAAEPQLELPFASTKFFKDLTSRKDFRYLMGQNERCPTTGRLHFQGYAQFTRGIRFSTVSSIDGKTHWEVAGGTRTDNKAYTSKEDTRVEGTFFEFGTPIAPGARTDLEEVVQMVKGGLPLRELLTTDIAARHTRWLLLTYDYFEPARTERPNVYVVWGEPGVGKTTWARETFPDAYRKNNSKWWDGYDRHETVIVNEFNPCGPGWDDWSLPYFLQVCDIDPFRVDIKGSHRQLVFKRIIFTSNQNPAYWYGTKLYEVLRRVTKFFNLVVADGVTEVKAWNTHEMCESLGVTEVAGNTRPPPPLSEFL